MLWVSLYLVLHMNQVGTEEGNGDALLEGGCVFVWGGGRW